MNEPSITSFGCSLGDTSHAAATLGQTRAVQFRVPARVNKWRPEVYHVCAACLKGRRGEWRDARLPAPGDPAQLNLKI